MARTVLMATLICGSLDIIFAIALGVIGGGSAQGVLRSVASGPFGNVTHLGPLGAVLGLVVHFAIMAAMVAVLALAFRRGLLSNTSIWSFGIGYGLILYVIMYWIVLPMRWPGAFPQTGLKDVAGAVFAHVVLVGLPMAHLLRGLRKNSTRGRNSVE